MREQLGGTMKRNIKLKAAIYASGRTSKQIAKEAGLSPAVLSQATTGRLVLTESERVAVARALTLRVADIFPRDES